MALFRDMVCYQEEVRDPVARRRGAEPRDLEGQAPVGAGADQHPARLLDPGDRHRAAGDRRVRAAGRRRARRSPRRPSCCRKRSSRSSCRAPASSSATRSPNAPRSPRSSMRRSAATTSTTTASPAATAWPCGPLGYNGSKAAMELIAKADVVLALGTRLNPFSTLPGYGIDYWPKNGQDHPGRHQRRPHRPHQAGHGRHLRRRQAGGQADPGAAVADRPATPGARSARRSSTRPSRPGCSSSPAWTTRTTIPARPGTRTRASATPTACRRGRPGARSRRACRRTRSSPATSATTAPSATPIRPSSRAGNIWRPACSGPAATASRRSSAPRSAARTRPCVGFAGDGAFGISMSEMSSIGRKEWPGITMVIFRNYQWGAEKRNSILWYDDNFVGTELDPASQLRQGGRGLRPEGRDGARRRPS